MPNGLGTTLTNKAGPLPVWAWAGLGTAGLAGFMIYRSKKAASTAAATQSQQGLGTSSNLGTIPISNLTTAAQPMPINTGDTFVNVQNPPDTTTVNNPVTVNNNPAQPLAPSTPPAAQIHPGTGLTHIGTPAQSQALQQQGYNIYTMFGGQWYNPAQPVKAGTAMDYVRINDPQQASWLAKQGCKILTLGNTQFYQWGQCKAGGTAGMPA